TIRQCNVAVLAVGVGLTIACLVPVVFEYLESQPDHLRIERCLRNALLVVLTGLAIAPLTTLTIDRQGQFIERWRLAIWSTTRVRRVPFADVTEMEYACQPDLWFRARSMLRVRAADRCFVMPLGHSGAWRARQRAERIAAAAQS